MHAKLILYCFQHWKNQLMTTLIVHYYSTKIEKKLILLFKYLNEVLIMIVGHLKVQNFYILNQKIVTM